jgi:hypothetical protein
MKMIFISLLLMAGFLSGYSQVMINLQLPPAGLTMKEQLWNLSLVNSGQRPVTVYLEMQLSDASGNQRILTGTTREFLLPVGVKQIRPADVTPINYNVVNPVYAVDAAPNGFLPVGVFTICYTVYTRELHAERIADECETIEVEPLSPPSLLFPADRDSVEQARPQFTWIPPAPMQLFSRLSYELEVVEVMPTQTPTDAIARNIPILVLPNVQQTTVVYPASVKQLDTARTYAWRVKAMNNGRPIANSDTWIFRLAQPAKEPPPEIPRYDYTKLSGKEEGSFTLSDGHVLFQYLHEFNDTSVNVKLWDLSGSKRLAVPLPEQTLSVAYGLNFEELNLTDKADLIASHLYLLELSDSRGRKQFMKFQYSKK